MNSPAIFGLSFLMSLLSSIVVAVLFAWPWLRDSNREQALIWLVAPHMFLRFIGLSFLVPGVVSASLPKAWAVPAAYGDFVAGILAIIATAALAKMGIRAIAAVWIFNIAFYKGAGAGLALEAGSLGAGFYLVTAVVPLLLVSHALIFGLLIRTGPESRALHQIERLPK